MEFKSIQQHNERETSKGYITDNVNLNNISDNNRNQRQQIYVHEMSEKGSKDLEDLEVEPTTTCSTKNWAQIRVMEPMSDRHRNINGRMIMDDDQYDGQSTWKQDSTRVNTIQIDTYQNRDPKMGKRRGDIRTRGSKTVRAKRISYLKETEMKFISKYQHITNVESFNLSNYNLTAVEKIILGLGIKYIPHNVLPIKHLQENIKTSLLTLQERMLRALYWGDNEMIHTTIPKNETHNKWQPPPQTHDNVIKQYINSAIKNSNELLEKTKCIYTNEDRLLIDTLKSLRRNNTITVKPADKNLGVVVMNTSDYKQMCLLHLNDNNTYIIQNEYNSNKIYAELRKILNEPDTNKLYISNTKKLTKLSTSLLQLQNHDSLRIAPFYTIPKIHKTLIQPVPGRPIVSSNSTATYHTSVYLDRELQCILKHLNTVCTSSRQVINTLHNRSFNADSIIMCADITSLYPNIPIDLGITVVKEVLQKVNIIPLIQQKIIIKLLTWVLKNNYCIFNEIIYLQIKGTAMGTPVAVTYSNIFIYGIEQPILQEINTQYYTRYIDDIFSIFNTTENAQNFLRIFNSYCPTIKLESVTISHTGIFLDLELQIIKNANTSIITHKIYQKPINKYQYIPVISNHNPTIFKNFVVQELKRYQLACTDQNDFNSIAIQFENRLKLRGYPQEIYNNAITLLPEREDQIMKLKNPTNNNNKKLESPIITICMPKLKNKIKWKEIFTIPEEITNLRAYKRVYKNNKKLMIGTKNLNNIGQSLIRAKYSQ